MPRKVKGSLATAFHTRQHGHQLLFFDVWVPNPTKLLIRYYSKSVCLAKVDLLQEENAESRRRLGSLGKSLLLGSWNNRVGIVADKVKEWLDDLEKV